MKHDYYSNIYHHYPIQTYLVTLSIQILVIDKTLPCDFKFKNVISFIIISWLSSSIRISFYFIKLFCWSIVLSKCCILSCSEWWWWWTLAVSSTFLVSICFILIGLASLLTILRHKLTTLVIIDNFGLWLPISGLWTCLTWVKHFLFYDYSLLTLAL